MDWSKVYLLLNIAEKTGGYPALAELHKEVNSELQKMNDDLKPKPEVKAAETKPVEDKAIQVGEEKPNKAVPIESVPRNPNGTIVTPPKTLINEPEPAVERRV